MAKRITKWDRRCDHRLHQVMSYISETLDYHAYGFIGDHPKDLTLHLYVDAVVLSPEFKMDQLCEIKLNIKYTVQRCVLEEKDI